MNDFNHHREVMRTNISGKPSLLMIIIVIGAVVLLFEHLIIPYSYDFWRYRGIDKDIDGKFVSRRNEAMELYLILKNFPLGGKIKVPRDTLRLIERGDFNKDFSKYEFRKLFRGCKLLKEKKYVVLVYCK